MKCNRFSALSFQTDFYCRAYHSVWKSSLISSLKCGNQPLFCFCEGWRLFRFKHALLCIQTFYYQLNQNWADNNISVKLIPGQKAALWWLVCWLCWVVRQTQSCWFQWWEPPFCSHVSVFIQLDLTILNWLMFRKNASTAKVHLYDDDTVRYFVSGHWRTPDCHQLQASCVIVRYNANKTTIMLFSNT